MDSIHTTRLLLRQPKGTDLKDFFECSKNPAVGINAGWKPHSDMKESLQILTDFINNGNIWAIVDKLTNKMIGTVGLVDDAKINNPQVKMLGYALNENFWGQGIATEAARAILDYGFNKQNIAMISVYHYTFNKRSKSVIAKCGFKYEGVLRNSALSLDNATHYDEACYSLTKQEYLDFVSNKFQ